jgi:hypothetical protein
MSHLRLKVEELVRELRKFPDDAVVEPMHGWLRIRPDVAKLSELKVVDSGFIEADNTDGRTVTKLNAFEGWQPMTTDGNKIRIWLRANPEKAEDIAFAAIAGLHLDHEYRSLLPTHNSNPRVSGSDYVDEVGEALDYAGIMPMLQAMRKASGVDDE